MSGLTEIPEGGSEFLQCVHRVAELPVVAAAVDGARGLYDRIKQAPVPLLGRTLDAAEATVSYAAAQAYPVAMKLEAPIQYIDSLACKGLDVVEENVPIVKETPDQIWTDAKSFVAQTTAVPVNFVSSVKSYGVAKVGAAADYGREKVIQVAKTTYGHQFLQSFDSVLGAANAVVDKYLPGQELEKQPGFLAIKNIEDEDKWDPALAPIAHAAGLIMKIVRRVYNLTLPKAHAVQRKCSDAIEQLPKQPTDVVNFVRTQISSGTHTLSDMAKNVWEGSATSKNGSPVNGTSSNAEDTSVEEDSNEGDF